MGPYVETSESATPTLLVLPQEPNLVRTTLCGVDTSSYGLTAIPRVQPGEPVAGNPLGGFCEGGRAQERCSRPVPTHHQVNHDRLIAAVAKRVADRRMLQLIGAFLKAGVLENGLVTAVDEGTPQGGPLSPLLSNLVLDELDRELEERGHRFARYADDCNIYVGSERAGQRVMKSVTRFITERLKLKVNQAKSAVARPGQRKFLGFSFTSEREPRRRIAPKAIARFKERIREMTSRTRGISLPKMVTETATYLRGWLGYFGECQTPSVLKSLESWLRRRLRSVVWKQGKRGRTRFKELRKRGVSKDLAAQTAGSAHGPWRIANSPALTIALPNAYFDSLGLPAMVVRS